MAVLRVIGELHGIERPDVDAETTHREDRGAIARVPEDDM
jgi:hypothetical protein